MASSPELEPPRVVAPDEGDILIEQLEYLIDHVEAAGSQACSLCERYARVRSILFEPLTTKLYAGVIIAERRNGPKP